MKKRMAGFLVLLFVMMTALTGCSGSNTLDATAEAMNVDGVSIPMGELNFYLRYQQTQLQNVYGMYFGEDFMQQDLMGLGVPYGETVRDTVVETLQEYYLVSAHAEELGISLTEEEKMKASEAAKAFIASNDSKTLEVMSADEAAVTHVLELMALQSKVYNDRAATIDTEVDPEEVAQKRISYVMTSTVGTSDAEGNVTELTEDELAEKMSMMERILAAAKESGDLNAAAEAEELTAASMTYGRDDSTLNEAVRNAADALADGEFSGVIEAESGYYIVYMESTYDEEATETKKQSLLAERENEAYAAWIDPIREASEITTNDEQIQSLTFERIFQVPAAE
ncbi:MAG: peptidyl-prolyl cis-trans isomerase [Clostridiales bacterium]|nr:peptidyl-prolyl cis-trans isomerase [Clostridiales bacterium]